MCSLPIFAVCLFSRLKLRRFPHMGSRGRRPATRRCSHPPRNAIATTEKKKALCLHRSKRGDGGGLGSKSGGRQDLPAAKGRNFRVERANPGHYYRTPKTSFFFSAQDAGMEHRFPGHESGRRLPSSGAKFPRNPASGKEWPKAEEIAAIFAGFSPRASDDPPLT